MNDQAHAFGRIQAEEFCISREPYYLPIGNEVALFESAYRQKIPVLLKGPTGSGKTRFVEYMSWKLNGPAKAHNAIPLITVACHEDLTASDLVGRYLLEGDTTRWIDGPLTRAVKVGAICYLDEIVEARKDTTVLIHPLADYRRLLPVEKKGELYEAADGFLLVMSYNPGYQSVLKDLKQSTRQRFLAIEFGYPNRDQETEIVMNECDCGRRIATRLAQLGEKLRHLKSQGLAEGVSTRLLVYAGKLISDGMPPRLACESAIEWSLTDDPIIQLAIGEVIDSILE